MTGLEAPAIAAIIGAVATVASTGVSLYAGYQQSQFQQKAAKYNAAVADENAKVTRQAAEMRADQHRAQARRVNAAVAARIGASGVQIEGSPGDVLIENARQAELGAQRIKWGGDVNALGFESQSRMEQFAAGQYARAGVYGAGTTLLSGAATAAGYGFKAYDAQKRGGG